MYQIIHEDDIEATIDNVATLHKITETSANLLLLNQETSILSNRPGAARIGANVTTKYKSGAK